MNDARTGDARDTQHQQWLEVKMGDGSAGVQVGQRFVPLDSISADTMPNEEMLIRADTHQDSLKDLYSRQVEALLCACSCMHCCMSHLQPNFSPSSSRKHRHANPDD